ncbi:MAG: universal stress protein [Abditibacteriales bacterium]|nr:universal stress protein [Abditibacteriales bacterium]MDW8365710.1 universal stress protein [Abditibacteriales bacterium]
MKSILVPLDGSEFSQCALTYGVELSHLFGATLRALYVVDTKMASNALMRTMDWGSREPPPAAEKRQALLARMEERGRQLLTEARHQTGCEVSLRVGVVPKEICEAALSVDLVIMGKRGESAAFGTDMLGSCIEATVRQSVKPVMLTPAKHAPLETLLVAFDGSRFAVRALEVATDMAAKLEAGLITLHVCDDPAHGYTLLTQAEQYVAPYGVPHQTVLERLHARSVGEVIVDCAQRFNVSLVCMGAYGHSRVRHLVIGGTTEEVMRNTACPVLLLR